MNMTEFYLLCQIDESMDFVDFSILDVLQSEPQAAHVLFIFQIKKKFFIFIFQIKSITKRTFWKKEQNGKVYVFVSICFCESLYMWEIWGKNDYDF